MSAQIIQNKKLCNSFPKPRILLVEDSNIIQQVIQYFFKELNCHVTLANCGKKAISLFQNGFDLILLDIGLPDIDGFEVAEKIRSSRLPNCKTIPILGHTAYPLTDVIQRCHTAGMNTVYNKIITLEEMQEILIRWLPSPLHSRLKETSF